MYHIFQAIRHTRILEGVFMWGGLMHIWRADSQVHFNIMAVQCASSTDSRAPLMKSTSMLLHSSLLLLLFRLLPFTNIALPSLLLRVAVISSFLKDITVPLHFYKSVTPRICPRKINDDVCNHSYSSVENYQFCRHWNTVVSVTCCPVLNH